MRDSALNMWWNRAVRIRNVGKSLAEQKGENCRAGRAYRFLVGIAAALCLHTAMVEASGIDVFRSQRDVPAVAAGSMLGGGVAVCSFGEIAQPLTLQETIERTLCNNPKTEEAWANVKVQAANVGIGQGAYMPTVSANWQGVKDNTATDVTNEPQLSTRSRSFVRTDSITAQWVLYDFGARKAALDNATELLAAARANQDATLQDAFARAGKDYYDAEALQSELTIAKEVEQSAKDSFDAATQRVEHGVAPITDKLQAETAYAQAVFARVKAAGDLATGLGKLASEMSLRPDTPIVMPEVSTGVAPDALYNESISELMDDAEHAHPTVLAAEAQLAAANAKTRQIRDQGLPSISLVTKYSRNNQPASLGLGVPTYPATGHDWYIGVQVTIPIFEGFVRTYQVRQQEAQAEVQQYTVEETRNQVAIDVWTSYQALNTATENTTNSATLLDIAQRSVDAARHRYTLGVGTVLELLTAQSAWATAKKQHVQALTDWRSARLQLAGKLGRLNLSF